jgi:hypothetical protein
MGRKYLKERYTNEEINRDVSGSCGVGWKFIRE